MRKKASRSLATALALLLLVATGAFAAMGEVAGFTFNGFGPDDAVGQGESSTPDGKPDARFSASISGAGALAGLMLRAVDGNGTWDTTPGNSSWGMRVKDNSGNLLTEANGRLPMVPFLLGLGVEFSVADNGAIARGGKFTLTARFLDNSEASSTITIPPSITATTARIVSVGWLERTNRDLTGRSEALQGDGRPDERIRLELEGEGTLTEIEVRNLVEGRPTAAWDTIPGNGRWALGVVRGRNTLNRNDGSVEIPLSGRSVLDLWMSDDGSIAEGKTRFEVILRFADGKRLRGTIAAQAAEPQATQAERLQATMMGEGNRDLVGSGEKRAGNGKPDWRIDVKMDSPGTVIGMKVTNVKGPSGEWDTLPGNGKWLLGVTRVNGETLNRSDGAINIPISEPMAFILWLENNGSLGRAETRSRLTLVYDDGRILEEDIKPQSAPVATGEGNFLEASLAGTGSYDYVGQGEKLAGNLNRDYRFDIRFTKTGTLTGVRLVNLTKGGEWDTIPNNSRWLLAVTRPGGGVLNAPNGSVKIPVEETTALHLWVEDNKTLADPASKWRISLAFSDGQLLEKEIGTLTAPGALPLVEKRELELTKPRQASSDFVGPYDRLLKNGKGDWVLTLKIKGRGTIKALSLRNIGVRGIWDTIPGNGRWTMAVRAVGGGMLSRPDGSVSFPVPPNRTLHLFVENNGTLQLPTSRYELTATWDDGTTTIVRVP
jgi:hypothetical protein